MNQPIVFIRTKEQQMLGAIASAHSFRRQSRHPRQQAFVFSLVKEGLPSGQVGEDFVRGAAAARDVRPSVFEVIAACGGCKPLAP